ncbi:hypothetical protein WEI85_26755 [Actinomycetes bacterium KLBMP 9797]
MSEPVPDGLRDVDGSTPAEDDALLRQPGDEATEDPDTERPGRPDEPAEGPDDPAYTGQ